MAPNGAFGIEQMSAYYLELERLLNRIEHASNHYQVLGLERQATVNEIKVAYSEATRLLRPPFAGDDTVFTEAMLGRIDRAFDRLARAFSVLTHMGKRTEYDNLLMPKSSAPLPIDTLSLDPEVIERRWAELAERRRRGEGLRQQQQVPAYFSIAHENQTNRRRSRRFPLTVPARVTGYDREHGRWEEVAETVDVSLSGMLIRLKKRVRHGLILHIAFDMPATLRRHGKDQPDYEVYALVRRVEQMGEARLVGLEFLGERPPLGFLNRPWATFRTPNWTGAERRREPRKEHSEEVAVEYLNLEGQPVGHAIATIENVSPSGARIRLETPAPEFELLRLITLTCSFESFATICNRYTDRDGRERLCLHFLNEKWPF